MSVRRVVPGDEPIVRSLRIAALTDAPTAFNSTLEHELAQDTEGWRRWITDGATFVFERPDGPHGIAAGFAHDMERNAIYLMSMWVRPESRGTGIAEALAASVISWGEEQGATVVVLHVGEHNDRARGFYERLGFRATGDGFVSERTGIKEVEMRYAIDRARAAPAGV